MLRLLRAIWNGRHGQAEHQRAHAFLERILNAVATPVFVKDRAHRFVLVNDALCSLLGRSRAELLGQSDHDFLPKAEADLFVRKDELVFTSGQVNTNEETLTDAYGAQHTIVTRKATFRDLDGREALVGVIDDITERKRMEDLLRLNAQVFEHSTEGMFITDQHNAILTVNRAFTEITGYSQDEVVGKNPRILSSGELPIDFYQEMWRSLLEQGCWQGEMLNRRKSGELYSEWLTISTIRNEGGVYRYIALFSDITKRKQAENRIRFLAHHDALTGLPNRALLDDRVEQAIARSKRSQASIALLMLDLDRFKQTNDALGHQAGDQMLKEVGLRLTICVRGSDTVARLGGDEFVVLLADTTCPDDARVVAEKIVVELNKPFLLEGREARIGVSIGISAFPRDGTDADSLLRSADEAMYRVKQSGRNNYAFAGQQGLASGSSPSGMATAAEPARTQQRPR